MIADNIAILADAVFNAAAKGSTLSFGDGWLGAFAYAIQIYFDFSGYSEMAIGLALLFGIRFPINFFSPYKATSLVEFWRRWHMTMTRFFQEFIYVPLSLSLTRLFRSTSINYIVIMMMMLLIGFWHGAGWAWILWGGVHGLMLCVNHLWRALRDRIGIGYDPKVRRSLFGASMSWALTFTCVSAAWVLFRADNIDTAVRIYRAMFMLNGIDLPANLAGLFGTGFYATLLDWGIHFVGQQPANGIAEKTSSGLFFLLFTSIVFVSTAPNILQLTRYYSDGRAPRSFTAKADSICDLDISLQRPMWRPSWGWACIAAGAFMSALLIAIDDTSQSVFIYFNF